VSRDAPAWREQPKNSASSVPASGGGAALTGLPADFGKLIADDTQKWGKVIRAANIKAE
jgi:hypothetical protein